MSTTEGTYADGTLVIYSAKWVSVDRYIKKLANSLREEGVLVVEIDIGEDSTVAQNSGVVVLPTFIFFKNNDQILHVGAINEEDAFHLCGVSRPKANRTR